MPLAAGLLPFPLHCMHWSSLGPVHGFCSAPKGPLGPALPPFLSKRCASGSFLHPKLLLSGFESPFLSPEVLQGCQVDLLEQEFFARVKISRLEKSQKVL